MPALVLDRQSNPYGPEPSAANGRSPSRLAPGHGPVEVEEAERRRVGLLILCTICTSMVNLSPLISIAAELRFVAVGHRHDGRRSPPCSWHARCRRRRPPPSAQHRARAMVRRIATASGMRSFHSMSTDVPAWASRPSALPLSCRPARTWAIRSTTGSSGHRHGSASGFEDWTTLVSGAQAADPGLPPGSSLLACPHLPPSATRSTPVLRHWRTCPSRGLPLPSRDA